MGRRPRKFDGLLSRGRRWLSRWRAEEINNAAPPPPAVMVRRGDSSCTSMCENVVNSCTPRRGRKSTSNYFRGRSRAAAKIYLIGNPSGNRSSLKMFVQQSDDPFWIKIAFLYNMYKKNTVIYLFRIRYDICGEWKYAYIVYFYSLLLWWPIDIDRKKIRTGNSYAIIHCLIISMSLFWCSLFM